MPVLTRLIPSPVVVDIRPGALDDLAGLLADQRISSSGRVAIAVSGGSGQALRTRLEPVLTAADWYLVADGTIDSAVRLADGIKGKRYDAVVGLGGGKIIDVAKYAAARVGLPLVAVATNLAHDGLCSPVSTLDNDNGRVPTVSRPPSRSSSTSTSSATPRSGSSAPVSVTRSPTSPPSRTGSCRTGSTASRSTDWPPPWPVPPHEAVLRHPGGAGDDEFLTVLSEALVLTGIAMSISGDTRPSSGACHEISHAFDLLHPTRRALHGEQVGLGAAFAMHLRGAHEESQLFTEVLHRHGLPVLPEEIGFSPEEFVGAVAYAPQTRPGRFTILEHLDLSTDQIRDAYADYAKTISS